MNFWTFSASASLSRYARILPPGPVVVFNSEHAFYGIMDALNKKGASKTERSKSFHPCIENMDSRDTKSVYLKIQSYKLDPKRVYLKHNQHLKDDLPRQT